jgi:hypothetical protein
MLSKQIGVYRRMGLFKDEDMTVTGSRRAMRVQVPTIEERTSQRGTRPILPLTMYVHDCIICPCALHWESRSVEGGESHVAAVCASCRTVRTAYRWVFRAWMMSSLILSNARVPARSANYNLIFGVSHTSHSEVSIGRWEK